MKCVPRRFWNVHFCNLMKKGKDEGTPSHPTSGQDSRKSHLTRNPASLKNIIFGNLTKIFFKLAGFWKIPGIERIRTSSDRCEIFIKNIEKNITFSIHFFWIFIVLKVSSLKDSRKVLKRFVKDSAKDSTIDLVKDS